MKCAAGCWRTVPAEGVTCDTCTKGAALSGTPTSTTPVRAGLVCDRCQTPNCERAALVARGRCSPPMQEFACYDRQVAHLEGRIAKAVARAKQWHDGRTHRVRLREILAELEKS